MSQLRISLNVDTVAGDDELINFHQVLYSEKPWHIVLGLISEFLEELSLSSPPVVLPGPASEDQDESTIGGGISYQEAAMRQEHEESQL